MTVRAERQTPRWGSMPFEFVCDLSGLRVPDRDRRVKRHRCQKATVRTEHDQPGHVRDKRGAACARKDHFSSVGFSDGNLPIGIAGSDSSPIRGEYSSSLALQSTYHLPGRNFSNLSLSVLPRLIPASRQQELAVGAETDGRERATLPVNLKLLPRRRVPD